MKTDALLHYVAGNLQAGLEYTQIWTPDEWRAPKGFPLRELLCVPSCGGKTWRVKTKRLHAFLVDKAAS